MFSCVVCMFSRNVIEADDLSPPHYSLRATSYRGYKLQGLQATGATSYRGYELQGLQATGPIDNAGRDAGGFWLIMYNIGQKWVKRPLLPIIGFSHL